MNKNSKIALILGVGALAATAAWYFLIYLPKHPKTDKNNNDTSNPGATTGGAATNVNNNLLSNPIPDSFIGKRAYAAKDAVKVLYTVDASTAGIKNKNEFIGVVDGKKTFAGSPFYTVAGGGMAVAVGNVSLK